MSIDKVARLAGVSTATVSRVLNQHPGVKPETREKVLSAIALSNYQPNLLARQLRTSRSRMLLVLVPGITNPFCSLVVRGIEEEAELHGYHILLCNSESRPTRESAYLALLSGKVVDGVITMDAISCLPGLTALIGDSPWVQCAEGDPAYNGSSVTIDNRAAAAAVVRHLAAKGRRRIALINTDMRYLYSHQREAGYRETLEGLGLSWCHVEYVDEVDYNAGCAAMTRLLQLPQPPDAIFAVSDVLAGGALHSARRAGLTVPQDLAVMGFDGVPFSAVTSPPLTTIEQPMHQLGVRSVQLLLARIKNHRVAVVHEVLDWKLVERGSA
ncbi:LacI family transcriptional regulator [Erwiniaceae bacterium BAC15a-03b]|uniref:LacI family transcriptional regulator n=1 Tax=Winslowiella arboricola TaxID=2978220 RepID=A0A9J6PRV6_9GAMM|nr:LacI family DNA-binding transcriptional regulator [Winslowiella arboricola]MCU5771830.1 LacI family transcriptional regulator [Winslowiella arboricola]MCU5777460.1 LacI family transcriptional regulator [Winslowiella arboricola]